MALNGTASRRKALAARCMDGDDHGFDAHHQSRWFYMAIARLELLAWRFHLVPKGHRFANKGTVWKVGSRTIDDWPHLLIQGPDTVDSCRSDFIDSVRTVMGTTA